MANPSKPTWKTIRWEYDQYVLSVPHRHLSCHVDANLIRSRKLQQLVMLVTRSVGSWCLQRVYQCNVHWMSLALGRSIATGNLILKHWKDLKRVLPYWSWRRLCAVCRTHWFSLTTLACVLIELSYKHLWNYFREHHHCSSGVIGLPIPEGILSRRQRNHFRYLSLGNEN